MEKLKNVWKKGMHCHNSLQADAVGNTHEETMVQQW